MRKKALSVISILMIIICLLPTIACSELRNDNFSNDSATKQVGRVLQDEKQDSAEDESDTVVVQSQEGFTSSSYETLSGVSPTYEIGIHSSVVLTDSNLIQYIAVSNQKEEPIVDLNAEKRNENYYISKKDNFEEGYTYTVNLLSDEVDFVDTRFSGKDSMSFTVDSPEIIDIEEKNGIDVIENFPVFTYQPEEILVADLTQDYGIQENDIVKIPVLYFGFEVQRYFVATKINKEDGFVRIQFREANIDEIYNEIEIYTDSGISAENTYVRYEDEPALKNVPEDAVQIILKNDQSIAEDVENSDYVQNSIARLAARKSGDVKITSNFEISDIIKDGLNFVQVENSTEIKLPLISNDNISFEFKIIVGMTYRIGVPHFNLNPFNKAFGVTIRTETETRTTFEYCCKKDLGTIGKLGNIISENGGLEDFKKFVKGINDSLGIIEKPTEKDLQVKVFDVYVPVAGGVLGIAIEVRISIIVEIKAELGATLTSTNVREFGIQNEGGLRFFNNVLEDTTKLDVSLEGTILVKAGPAAGVYISLGGIVNAGIELSAGVYAKAVGVFSIQFRADMEVAPAMAGYVEVGLYMDFSVVAEVDFGFWTGRMTVNLLPKMEVPFLQWGKTKMVTLQPKTESLMWDDEGIEVPQIDVVVLDLLTHEKTITTINCTDFGENFEMVNNSENFSVNGSGEITLKEGHEEEFEEEVRIQLKDYEKYFGDTPEYPTFYVGINPEEYLVTSFTITKQPIAIDELTLSYEQITDDPGYAAISGIDYAYEPRNTEDFQIGRLVRVVPEITPLDASYKTLNYTVTKGAEYIQSFETYVEGGITYAQFRVKNDTANIGKAVQISATSNGYTGEYADYNITGTSEKDLIIAEIPADDFALGIRSNDTLQQMDTLPQSIYIGETYVFDFIADSIVPGNATLTGGNVCYDDVYIKSGAATVQETDNGWALTADEGAQEGGQIILAARIGDVEKEYYLNIKKKAVEYVTLQGGEESISAGSSRTISVSTATEDGIVSVPVTVTLLEGQDICTVIQEEGDFGSFELRVSETAQGGEKIRVVAEADGVLSEVLEFTVSSVPVTSIVLSADTSETTVQKGQEIQLSVQIQQSNATYDTIEYKIVEAESSKRGGKYIGELDGYTGLLKIAYNGIYPDKITVVAVVDGQESNALTFTLEKTAVTSIEFVPNQTYLYVELGAIITLNARVNQDASVQDVTYTLDFGEESGSLNGNILTITEEEKEIYPQIRITARSVDNPDVSVMIFINVIDSPFQIYLNGEAEFAYPLSTDEMILTAEYMGEPVSLNEIEFEFYDEYYMETEDLSIEGNELVLQDWLYNQGTLLYYIDCYYGSEYSTIELHLIRSVENIIALPVDAENIKAGDEVKFNVYLFPQNVDYQGRVRLEIVSGSATVIDEETIYILPSAIPGSEVTVRAYWEDDQGHRIYGESVTFTVKSGIESVEIINIRETMYLGESYQLKAVYTPTNQSSHAIRYGLAMKYDEEFVTLDEETGVLTISDDPQYLLHTIEIRCYVIGANVTSQTYTIKVVGKTEEVVYRPVDYETQISYIEERGVYLLKRGSELQFKALTVDENGQELLADDVQWVLDDYSAQYLNVASDGTVSVKLSAPNMMCNVSLFGMADGVAGEVIHIVLAKEISTVSDFEAIRDNYYGYYVLRNDIDFNYSSGDLALFEPFPVFYGILDGNGHQLRNIMFDTKSEATDYGMILHNYGDIRNLTLQTSISFYDSLGKGVRYVGGITAINSGTLYNCTVSSAKYFYVANENSYVGGLAGLNEGLITESRCYMIIFGDKYAGGIAGKNTGTVEYCANLRNLFVDEENDETGVSGIVGDNSGTVTGSAHFAEVYVGLDDFNFSEEHEDIAA